MFRFPRHRHFDPEMFISRGISEDTKGELQKRYSTLTYQAGQRARYPTESTTRNAAFARRDGCLDTSRPGWAREARNAHSYRALKDQRRIWRINRTSHPGFNGLVNSGGYRGNTHGCHIEDILK